MGNGSSYRDSDGTPPEEPSFGANEASYSDIDAEYHAISPTLFQDQDPIPVPIYYRFNNNYILFRRPGSIWSQHDSQHLTDLGITELHAKVNEATWQSLVEKKMNRLLESPSVPGSEKAKMIYSASTSAADSFFRNPRSHESARRVVSFVKHSVDYFTSDKDAFWNVFEGAHTTLQEQTHGLHCAAYAVRLAQQIGQTDTHRLSALAIGATLHDIGKCKIDRAILDKEGPLNDAEWVLIKKHSQFGYEMTEGFSSLIPDLSRQIILEHHERPDGSGYPHGLKSEIHLFSHIVAIADVFDSMTSHRPYKRQSSSLNTMLELLQTQMGRLQPELLVAFVEMMKK